MAQQTINVGSAPDDGTGDPARVAFTKCNANFTELYTADTAFLTTTAAAATYQPLDADLTALAALTGTNTIYYRSGTSAWTAVTIGTGLTFAAGTLDRAALTGDVTASAGSNATTIANDAVTYAKMQNISAASLLIGRGAAAGAGDPQEITLGTNLSMTGTTLNATGGSSVTDPTPPQGRMTLQTATPVMTTTQSAKTTIFYTPYCGNKIPLYDGTNMVMTTFAELSVATTDTTKSPAAIGASKVNDWFVWNDAGTIRIGHGPDWTSDTARSAGTALVMVNGILLNNAAITNGPAASRGTYVGTTRSNASSQLNWIYGAVAANGTAGVLNVWNAYNRVLVATSVGDNTNSWTYSSPSWRAANGSATMCVNYVVGLAEDAIDVTYTSMGSVSGSSSSVGIGVDATTTFSGASGINNSSFAMTALAAYVGVPGIGAHFIFAIEYSSAATTTFYGDAGQTWVQSGLNFSLMM